MFPFTKRKDVKKSDKDQFRNDIDIRTGMVIDVQASLRHAAKETERHLKWLNELNRKT